MKSLTLIALWVVNFYEEKKGHKWSAFLKYEGQRVE